MVPYIDTYATGSKVTSGSTAGANSAARNARPAGSTGTSMADRARQAVTTMQDLFGSRRGNRPSRRNR